MLDTGLHATIEDLAKAMGANATYVSRVLRLTLLAPEIVEAILSGRRAVELQLDDLLEWFPVAWEGAAPPSSADGPIPRASLCQRVVATILCGAAALA
jgi:hypothetical protein